LEKSRLATGGAAYCDAAGPNLQAQNKKAINAKLVEQFFNDPLDRSAVFQLFDKTLPHFITRWRASALEPAKDNSCITPQ
jgi:hypothetical protein